MSRPYVPPPPEPLTVHWIDAELLIVDKPSGLLTVPGRGPDKADCLWSRLAADYGDIEIVHRLDMETSGLVIFARSKAAQRAMSMAFERRGVSKTYEAMVWGDVLGCAGEIDLPLITDWPNRPRQTIDYDNGKPSQTEWTCLGRSGDRSRLKLVPITGRSHQLRVHLDAIGHPILGDSLYGSPDSRAAARRLLLHATELVFAHPVTGARVSVTSCAPF